MQSDDKLAFLIGTKDKASGRPFHISVIASKRVEYPPIDLTDDELFQEALKDSELFNKSYKVPFFTSPLFWKDDKKEEYIIHVRVNDRYIKDRVLTGNTVRHVLAGILIVNIEKEFNQGIGSDGPKQAVGHALDLDVQNYSVNERVTRLNPTRLMVNEKPDREEPKMEQEERAYDLYYRPGLKVLTCSIASTEMPTAMGFNDDRFIVKLNDKTLVDIYLPFFIDTNEPIKYKYDDKTNNFRAVIKVTEDRRDE